MVAVVVIVGDEGRDLGFEMAGQEVIFQQDAVLEGLVPALSCPGSSDDRARRAQATASIKRIALLSLTKAALAARLRAASSLLLPDASQGAGAVARRIGGMDGGSKLPSRIDGTVRYVGLLILHCKTALRGNTALEIEIWSALESPLELDYTTANGQRSRNRDQRAAKSITGV